MLTGIKDNLHRIASSLGLLGDSITYRLVRNGHRKINVHGPRHIRTVRRKTAQRVTIGVGWKVENTQCIATTNVLRLTAQVEVLSVEHSA